MLFNVADPNLVSNPSWGIVSSEKSPFFACSIKAAYLSAALGYTPNTAPKLCSANLFVHNFDTPSSPKGEDGGCTSTNVILF